MGDASSPQESKSVDKIPVVDLHNLYQAQLDTDDEKIRKIAAEFCGALHEYGFAYVTNHGIPDDVISEAYRVSREFFDLPKSVKEKYVKEDAMKNFHGYAQPGMELLNEFSVLELRESFDFFKTDRYYPTEDVPEFEKKLVTLETACGSLLLKLLKLVAISLKMDHDLDFFCKAARNLTDSQVDSYNVFRTLYYPPIPKDVEITPGTLRCAAHTDWGLLTLLFQDEIGGLEVKTAKDTWIQATPIPGTIVVNTGDLLDIWTRHYLPATKHRVLIPEAEIKKNSCRQSIAYFLTTDAEVMVSPLTTGIFENDPIPDVEPIKAKDYFQLQAAKAYGKY